MTPEFSREGAIQFIVGEACPREAAATPARSDLALRVTPPVLFFSKTTDLPPEQDFL
jgi:hypothetical protein